MLQSHDGPNFTVACLLKNVQVALSNANNLLSQVVLSQHWLHCCGLISSRHKDKLQALLAILQLVWLPTRPPSLRKVLCLL